MMGHEVGRVHHMHGGFFTCFEFVHIGDFPTFVRLDHITMLFENGMVIHMETMELYCFFKIVCGVIRIQIHA